MGRQRGVLNPLSSFVPGRVGEVNMTMFIVTTRNVREER